MNKEIKAIRENSIIYTQLYGITIRMEVYTTFWLEENDQYSIARVPIFIDGSPPYYLAVFRRKLLQSLENIDLTNPDSWKDLRRKYKKRIGVMYTFNPEKQERKLAEINFLLSHEYIQRPHSVYNPLPPIESKEEINKRLENLSRSLFSHLLSNGYLSKGHVRNAYFKEFEDLILGVKLL